MLLLKDVPRNVEEAPRLEVILNHKREIPVDCWKFRQGAKFLVLLCMDDHPIEVDLEEIGLSWDSIMA